MKSNSHIAEFAGSSWILECIFYYLGCGMSVEFASKIAVWPSTLDVEYKVGGLYI